MACEFTNATTTQCVDAQTGAWATDLLADLDLPVRLFGEIVRPGTVLGPLSLKDSPGLDGAVVVAPACHDTGSAFAAVEAGGDRAFLSCGTWSLLGTEMPAPVITARSRDLNFTNEGGVSGTFRLLKNIGGLWLLQACRRVWAEREERWSYEDLVDAARDDRYAFRAVLDPDDPRFLNPRDMTAEIDVYCAERNQPSPESAGGYTRAILESLALKYRLVLDALEEVSGRTFRTVRMVGGGFEEHSACPVHGKRHRPDGAHRSDRSDRTRQHRRADDRDWCGRLARRRSRPRRPVFPARPVRAAVEHGVGRRA